MGIPVNTKNKNSTHTTNTMVVCCGALDHSTKPWESSDSSSSSTELHSWDSPVSWEDRSFSSLSQLEAPTSTASQSLGKVEWHGFSQALLSRGSSPCVCSVLRLCISSGGGVASKAGFLLLLLFQCPAGFLGYRIQNLVQTLRGVHDSKKSGCCSHHLLTLNPASSTSWWLFVPFVLQSPHLFKKKKKD